MPVAKDVEIGAWIIFNREPYKVKRKETVTAGTHMHSKLKFILQGLFGGEKSAIYAHNDKVDFAELEMKTGQVISVSGSTCQVMDGRTYEVEDAEIPEGIEVQPEKSAQYVTYNGKTTIVNVFK